MRFFALSFLSVNFFATLQEWFEVDGPCPFGQGIGGSGSGIYGGGGGGGSGGFFQIAVGKQGPRLFFKTSGEKVSCNEFLVLLTNALFATTSPVSVVMLKSSWS